MSFTDEEVQGLNTRVASMDLPEDWYVGLPRMLSNNWCAVFRFDCGDEPEVDPTSAYLAQNYGVGNAVPGCVKFYDYYKAMEFLTLVELYARESRPINYEAVLKAVQMIHYDTWASAVYTFAEEWTVDLPVEAKGAPYWMEDLNRLFYGAELTTTVGESNAYGYAGDIVQPEDEAAILIATLFDSSEGEVELAPILETCGIEDDSLEESLLRQLVCTNDTEYAYVRYDLMAAVWLNAVPENRGFLDALTAVLGK